MSYLDNVGLAHLWDKIKDLTDSKADKATVFEYKGVIYDDANNATSMGIYDFSAYIENHPIRGKNSVCLVLNYNENMIIQFVMVAQNKKDPYLYKRVCYYGSWGSWYRYVDDSSFDYIVEKGTSSGWEYTKWNSGKVELTYKDYSFSNLTWTSWGGLYYSKPSVSIPSGLLYNPTYIVNVFCNQSNFFMVGSIYQKTTTSFTPALVRPNNTMTSSSGTIQITGIWKWD